MEEFTRTSELERLQLFNENHRESLLNKRMGEFRFGEKVRLPNPELSLEENLAHSPCEVVIVGINEDLGVRANFGRPGTSNAWEQSIPHLFNVQDNDYLKAEKVLLLGQIRFSDLDHLSQQLNTNHPEDMEQLRNMVTYIDGVVYSLARKVFDSGKKLIVIGGGHNNCYPLIKALHDSKGQKVSVLNFDPHADLRDAEGRHSGNGFTYALEEQLLAAYHIFGLGESVNNTAILRRIAQHDQLSMTTMEEILDRGLTSANTLLTESIKKLPLECTGLEIDMDVLTHYPASALNSAGFTGNELRSLVRCSIKALRPSYVHICEAAPELANSSAGRSQAANFLAKLTADVCKKLFK
ncbi:MAG: arginase family protein [Cryomorphaceae bacterium]|nr:arginase family protein [Cryomorphaceae bacterium]